MDDLADACIFLMKSYNEKEFLNIGVGEDISILDLAKLVRRIVGFNGEIFLDETKPDGTPRKLLDVSRMNEFGWKAKIDLHEGIKKVYQEIQNATWA